MDKKKEPSPFSILWKWAKKYHGGFYDSVITAMIGVAAGYMIKAVCSTISTTLSHTATYHTLRDLREQLLKKLSRLPMGVILDTPSGQYKTTDALSSNSFFQLRRRFG